MGTTRQHIPLSWLEVLAVRVLSTVRSGSWSLLKLHYRVAICESMVFGSESRFLQWASPLVGFSARLY